MNWHKKQLKMWVVQHAGGPEPWKQSVSDAAEKFFAQPSMLRVLTLIPAEPSNSLYQ